MTANTSAKQVERETRHWLETIVVGLNLCPFAAPVLKQNTLHIEVCDKTSEQDIYRAVLEQMDFLQTSDENVVSTSLLVFSQALETFDDYLMVVEMANELLEQVGLDGHIQIASFHPQYCFAGVPEEDISHYTNRSPYPMLHFIREAQMARMLKNYPDPEAIPDNNIECLRKLGLDALQQLLRYPSVKKQNNPL